MSYHFLIRVYGIEMDTHQMVGHAAVGAQYQLFRLSLATTHATLALNTFVVTYFAFLNISICKKKKSQDGTTIMPT